MAPAPRKEHRELLQICIDAYKVLIVVNWFACLCHITIERGVYTVLEGSRPDVALCQETFQMLLSHKPTHHDDIA